MASFPLPGKAPRLWPLALPNWRRLDWLDLTPGEGMSVKPGQTLSHNRPKDPALLAASGRLCEMLRACTRKDAARGPLSTDSEGSWR